MDQQEHILIPILGWIYFFAWSISFYGQIYTNFRVKSVQGMNFDFVAMNLTGFLFYSIYNTYGYFVNQDQTGQVDLNDLIFSYHALFATFVTVSQIAIYPHKKNKVHAVTILFLISLWTFAVVYGTLTMPLHVISPQPRLGVISFLGYFKLAISTLKYLPQFYWNYQRKSTKGWSIFNIIMDLTGGLFSFGQLAAQKLYGLDVQINIVKLVLGIMVVVYDCVFIVQHYCIYGQKQNTDDQITINKHENIGNYQALQEEKEQTPQPQPTQTNVLQSKEQH